MECMKFVNHTSKDTNRPVQIVVAISEMRWKWGVGGGHWIPFFSIYYNTVKLFCSSPFRTSTVSYPPNFPVISGPLQYCCLIWREKTTLKVFLQLKWGFITSFHKCLRNSLKYEWRCDNLAWQFFQKRLSPPPRIYFWDNLKVITTWPVEGRGRWGCSRIVFAVSARSKLDPAFGPYSWGRRPFRQLFLVTLTRRTVSASRRLWGHPKKNLISFSFFIF